MAAYLDNSATTRPSAGVIEAMARCMREDFYNPSALYAPALRAEQHMKRCREEILTALSAREHEVWFTSGGTEANNLAILGAVRALHGPQRIVTTAVEHPSVLEAFLRLRAEGHTVTVLPVDAGGALDWPALLSALAEKPALISCMQVNNETGALLDVAALGRAVKEVSPATRVHIDGVQGFLRQPITLKDVDLYTLSGHKIHGPKGVGALVVRKGLRLMPRQLGGGQEMGLRSGTENTPGIAGLFEAAREMRAMENLAGELMRKKRLLADSLAEAVAESRVNGPAPADGAPHILNVSFPGVRAEVMLHALEAREIYVSTGSACSSKKRKVSAVLTAMHLPAALAESAIRFSLSPYTSEEEILETARAVGAIYASLSRYQRR